ncbi:hypothetical protein SMACR_08151 [Sordaria macrospora]|uniref:WGS project CABT00000000 data, contig 2.3 n=2 Tax=Sordaria macrospora TaxID=5147 RepID=F7VQ20_SORMK|nr:uncharacterized protein SMAC_08151 [Sordaria macrospora k-hell]KAA8628195.1 hypothetical protein SMACR_08151 [Sordaria macrospora]WPJ64992.1 hypothetical protein SMAC4_08151 [Sordaria macrospora]CCC07598.1 unnamed protein product [Sordaria macrospora k-hell]
MTSLGLLLLGLSAFLSTAWSSSIIDNRQYYPGDPSEGGPVTPQSCTETSFTSPRWGIYSPTLVTVNGSSGGSQGDIRFLTVNIATNVSAACIARNINLDPKGPDALNIWHDCDIPNLKFQFNLTSFDMRLRGTWLCENTTGFTFTAQGVWEQPLIQGCLDDWQAPRGQETLCIMGNSQVWGSLTTPVQIQPQLPIRPYTPSELPERCVDRSWDPQWLVESLVYRNYSSISGGNSTKETQELTFELTNISNEKKSHCLVTSLGNFTSADGSTPWVPCQTSGPDEKLSVMLAVQSGILGVRQDWNCLDGIEGIEPNHYSGTGFMPLSFTCGPPTNQTIRSLRGRVSRSKTPNTFRCTTPATNFTGYEASQLPVMPHTLYTRSCTVGSVTNTSSLIVRGYEIRTETIPRPSKSKTVSGTFDLYNPGSGDTYRLHGLQIQDDGAWHECKLAPTESGEQQPLPWQLYHCEYRFGPGLRDIAFKLKWECDDRDPLHPVLFAATANSKLPAQDCSEWRTLQGFSSSCRLPEFSIPVESLSWSSLSSPMERGPTLPWV